MRTFILAIAFLFAGCASKESSSTHEHSATEDQATAHDASSHDAASHTAAGMVLDAGESMIGDHSLYQIETTWKNQSGADVLLSSLAGVPQVVAMTYTSCEVSCPRIVAAMQQLQRESKTKAGFILISIDPVRDTPSQLQAYAEKMKLLPEHWNLLTSSEDDVREMAALLGVRYQQMPDGEFAHSNIITVLDAEGVVYHQQNGLAMDLAAETLSKLNALARN